MMQLRIFEFMQVSGYENNQALIFSEIYNMKAKDKTNF